MPDLWPADFGKASDVPPIVVLREQADLLSKKTTGEILGEVTTGTSGQDINHWFYLVVPRLDNYRYHLLTVKHSVGLYPAEILSIPSNTRFTSTKESQFIEHLRDILNNPDTKRVVASLVQQAKASGEPPPGAQVGVS